MANNINKGVIPVSYAADFVNGHKSNMKGFKITDSNHEYNNKFVYSVECVQGSFIKIFNYSIEDSYEPLVKSTKTPLHSLTLASSDTHRKKLEKLLVPTRDSNISLVYDISHTIYADQVFVIGDFEPEKLKEHSQNYLIETIYISAPGIHTIDEAKVDLCRQCGIQVAAISDEVGGHTLTNCLKNIFMGKEDANVYFFLPVED